MGETDLCHSDVIRFGAVQSARICQVNLSTDIFKLKS